MGQAKRAPPVNLPKKRQGSRRSTCLTIRYPGFRSRAVMQLGTVDRRSRSHFRRAADPGVPSNLLTAVAIINVVAEIFIRVMSRHLPLTEKLIEFPTVHFRQPARLPRCKDAARYSARASSFRNSCFCPAGGRRNASATSSGISTSNFDMAGTGEYRYQVAEEQGACSILAVDHRQRIHRWDGRLPGLFPSSVYSKL